MKKIVFSMVVLASLMATSCLRHDIKEAMEKAKETNEGNSFFDVMVLDKYTKHYYDTLDLGRYDFTEMAINGNVNIEFSDSIDKALVTRETKFAHYKISFDPTNKNRIIIVNGTDEKVDVKLPTMNTLDIIEFHGFSQSNLLLERRTDKPIKLFVSDNAELNGFVSAPMVTIEALKKSEVIIDGYVDNMNLKMKDNAVLENPYLRVKNLNVELFNKTKAAVACEKVAGNINDESYLITYGKDVDGSQLKVSKGSNWIEETSKKSVVEED